MIRCVAEDKDLRMESVPHFWITIQSGYAVLNWRAITGRPMCHHLVLCNICEKTAKTALEHLSSQLSDLIASL